MAIFHQLVHLVFALFTAHELAAIFLLLTIEEAGIPIPVPGDTLLVLAGAHHSQSVLYISSVLAVSTFAVFCGSSILFWLMRTNGRVLLARYGKYLHLKPERVSKLEGWFERHGPVAIVLGRLIPGLRMPTTIMAGLSGIPYRVFAPTAMLAALIWSAVYFWLGTVITRGTHFIFGFVTGLPDDISDTILVWLWILLGLAVLGGLLGTIHLRRRARREHLTVSEQGQ